MCKFITFLSKMAFHVKNQIYIPYVQNVSVFYGYLELPKIPNGKTQCPGIRYVILIQTFSENVLKIG